MQEGFVKILWESVEFWPNPGFLVRKCLLSLTDWPRLIEVWKGSVVFSVLHVEFVILILCSGLPWARILIGPGVFWLFCDRSLDGPWNLIARARFSQ